MEHLERPLKGNGETLYPTDLEKASNSYLMAVVGIISGLPLPIVNTIAAFGYYLSQRRSSYFVRWHCIQSLLAQALMIPLNSIAFAWTLSNILNHVWDGGFGSRSERILIDGGADTFFGPGHLYYWLYICFIIVLNIAEFIAVIYTSIRVRKGHNVRWAVIAPITDRLCSRENRDPYRI